MISSDDQRSFTTALEKARIAAARPIGEALEGQRSPVAQAMRYATEGGKGLRAFLVLESARLHGIDPDDVAMAAAAVEAMHAYSLVHDDLPCMDDDDLRRGRPTVHRKWDESTAILAGDALQTLAFSLLAQAGGAADRRLALLSALAHASGIHGMVGGQELDIAAETAKAPLNLDEITRLQAGKTGALIVWSATSGAILAGADLSPLTRYAEYLGLAFQIADDILDVEGDAAKIGKAVGKDAEAGKATFVSLLGLSGAKHRARELIDGACEELGQYGEDAAMLRVAARFVIERQI